MKLLIQEYLYMLRESDELDKLVVDLVSAMGLRIVTTAQKGVRQDGVDIHAVGTDPDDGQKKNFLITIKRGDVDRLAWDSGPQTVRQSLNEILDVFIPNKLGPRNETLKNKIILCCGGELKQEAYSNWVGFQKTPSAIGTEFDLWNGNGLSELIETYLLSESIFFEDVRRGMRRTLVVLSDVDYDLSHYKRMIEALLFGDNWASQKPASLRKSALKAFGAVAVSLGMINEYSKEAKNLKHPFLAAEYAMLRTWDFIQRNNLAQNKKVLNVFATIQRLYFSYGIEYANKVGSHCFVRDGITKSCVNSTTASQVTFEQIGIFASIGLSQFFFGKIYGQQRATENARGIADALKALIENHGISASPIFDGMTIDICLGILFLFFSGETECAKQWLFELVHRFNFSYVILERHFPIYQDSLEKLLEFEAGDKISKAEMASISTLLPNLAYWCVLLDHEVAYDRIVKFVETELNHSCLQVWYPTEGIKKVLFSKYSGNEGVAEVPVYLPKTLAELTKRIQLLMESAKKNKKIDTELNDCPPALPLVASRHFRTPVNPFYWLMLIPPAAADEATPEILENV